MRHLTLCVAALSATSCLIPADDRSPLASLDEVRSADFDCSAVPPTDLRLVYDRYLSRTASTGCPGCHSSAGAGGLLFNDAAQLHAAAVNVPSTQLPELMRVNPGSPHESYLYLKLIGAGLGERMRQGGPYLDQAGLDAVAGWICAGALPASAAGGASISGLAPTSGGVGTVVAISGAGFSVYPSQNAVAFNGAAAAVLSAAPNRLEVAVPAGATSGPVTVTVAGKTATGGTFTVLTGNPVPQLSALSPCGVVAGGPELTLTLDGSGFLPETTVTFLGTSVTVTSQTATQLKVTVPAALLASAPSGFERIVPVVASNPTPGGGSSAPFDFGLAGQAATLTADVQPIFTTSCATSGCHATKAPVLTADRSFAELVNKASTGCVGRQRVLPCGARRSKSTLIDKLLAGAGSPACSGTKMPPSSTISDADLGKIADWVAQGAPQ